MTGYLKDELLHDPILNKFGSCIKKNLRRKTKSSKSCQMQMKKAAVKCSEGNKMLQQMLRQSNLLGGGTEQIPFPGKY